jgi:hypothetical protein
MVVSFDNDVVATKAWNYLFAVADWATSRQKQKVPAQAATEMGRDTSAHRRERQRQERPPGGGDPHGEWWMSP